MICSIVVLYEPREKEIENISGYYGLVDKVFVLDNSKESNENFLYAVLQKNWTDGSKMYEKIVYKHFQRNIGLCKALNYGMKKASEIDCEWALIMDADSSILTNIVEIYNDFLKKNKYDNIGILSPIHIYDRRNSKKYSGFKKKKWAMTSGCFYNISIFEKIGGFMEELFVDGLDMDYCYRLNQRGYQVIELGDAQIKHYPAQTKTVSFAGNTILKYGYASPWRYCMAGRALVWVVLEYKSIHALGWYFIKWAKIILLFDNKRNYIHMMAKGSREGFNLWRQAHILG